MGLAISVGFLADMKAHDAEGYEWAKSMFDTTNAFLRSEGLPMWDEPEELPAKAMRPHVGSFPYSYLHYLRRAYAHAYERPDEELEPTGPKGLTDDDDMLIDDAGSMMSSHLLCHSDCEGLYVPVEFSDPLFDLDDMGVPGAGMLGSSYALREELREVAPYIGVTLEDGEITDAEAARLYASDDSNPWDREHVVFLTLWEATKASIAHGTAIVFT